MCQKQTLAVQQKRLNCRKLRTERDVSKLIAPRAKAALGSKELATAQESDQALQLNWCRVPESPCH
jgi:hypothetical protein